MAHWPENIVTREILRHRMGRKVFRNFGPQYALKSVDGIQMLLDLRDEWGVSKYILKHGHYDRGIDSLLKKWLRKDDFVLDLGANIGYWTVRLAKVFECKVYAFEPDPTNFKLLSENVEMNGIKSRTKLFQKAVGEQRANMDLFRSADNYGDHKLFRTSEVRSSSQVEVVRVDDQLSNKKVSFVKIDVQGFEPKVMRGMVRVLTENKDIKVMSEFWPHGLRQAGSSPVEYLSFMIGLGFNIHFIDEKTMTLKKVNPEELMAFCPSEVHCDVLFSRMTSSP